MRLRAKFSLLLASCVLVSVIFTTFAQSRFFTSDQQAYMQDLQSSIALYCEKELNSRLTLLYSQLEGFTLGQGEEFTKAIHNIPGAVRGELWDDGRLLSAFPGSEKVSAPRSGIGSWSLLPPPVSTGADNGTIRPPTADTGTIRWIARYSKRTAVLDLSERWFDGVLDGSHGVTSRILTSDGIALLSSRGTERQRFERPVPPGLLKEILAGPATASKTRRFRSQTGADELGTFLVLDAVPPLIIVVTSPWSAIESVIRRTYRQSAWVAALCVMLAIGIGVIFSGSLTSPLQHLARQTIEVAKGNFDVGSTRILQRHDEVGILGRSFDAMQRDLQKVREELRRGERLAAFGKFSSSIAHEIKNPLSSILGNTQVARRALKGLEGKSLDSLLRALDFVEEETKRANRIVNRLMTFARQEQPPSTSIDLSDRVSKALAILAPSVTQEGIVLQAPEIEPGIHLIADEDQIHEVIVNLVQNAAHALRDSPTKRLEVSLRREAGMAVLSVQDSGHGIPAKVKEHLFEPFFTTKPIGQGTGLGLAVCHGIVTSHGGKISVTSEEGKGTTFHVYLPLGISDGKKIAA